MNKLVLERKQVLKDFYDTNIDIKLIEDAMKGANLSKYIPEFRKYNFKKLRIGKYNAWKYMYSFFLNKDFVFGEWLKNVNPNTTNEDVKQRIADFCKEVVYG